MHEVLLDRTIGTPPCLTTASRQLPNSAEPQTSVGSAMTKFLNHSCQNLSCHPLRTVRRYVLSCAQSSSRRYTDLPPTAVAQRAPSAPAHNTTATNHHPLGRCGTAHGASATCARAAPATQQSPGYSTRTRHRQMTGRVIGSETVRDERSTDYSVMHRNANAAAKVTAKTLFRTLSLPTARLRCKCKNGLKRNITLHGSRDHDRRSKEAFQEFSKQSNTHLNSA